jgi:hypothetical protein
VIGEPERQGIAMVRSRVLVGAVCVLLGLVTPAAAQAAGAPEGEKPLGGADAFDGSCPQEHICFYPEPFFNGRPEVVRPIYEHFCGEVGNAPARSVINNSRWTWTLHTEPGCRGEKSVIEPGGEVEFAFPGVYSWY